MTIDRLRVPRGLALVLVLACLSGADAPRPAARKATARPAPSSAPMRINEPVAVPVPPTGEAPAAEPAAGSPLGPIGVPDLTRSATSVGFFMLASLAPAGVLMVTAFVRFNIVLLLLRQALGSPQVPGNQVVSALALLLTALAMKPEAEVVYRDAVAPLAAGKIAPAQAWDAGSRPIKAFMIQQIIRSNNQRCLWDLYDAVEPPVTGRVEPRYHDEFPLRVVAPAFLISELKTAFLIGFAIYLPFLVVDLVVSAVLAAMGLFMLPPTLVAMPLKLILFVLADGWLLVSRMLLRSVVGD